VVLQYNTCDLVQYNTYGLEEEPILQDNTCDLAGQPVHRQNTVVWMWILQLSLEEEPIL
jgi:hypothetical protein